MKNGFTLNFFFLNRAFFFFKNCSPGSSAISLLSASWHAAAGGTLLPTAGTAASSRLPTAQTAARSLLPTARTAARSLLPTAGTICFRCYRLPSLSAGAAAIAAAAAVVVLTVLTALTHLFMVQFWLGETLGRITVSAYSFERLLTMWKTFGMLLSAWAAPFLFPPFPKSL
jgi:hypothetical protein